MDLPTYTSIWRIEKRLYKLYDFRLPVPIPVVTLAVAVGVFLVWAFLMRLLGVPFAPPFGQVIWLIPPALIAWFATRPVVEGKRLTELLSSQTRYATEGSVYCRLTAEHEPTEIVVAARVWHRHPEAPPLPLPGREQAKRRRRARTIVPEELSVEPEAIEEFPPSGELAPKQEAESAAATAAGPEAPVPDAPVEGLSGDTGVPEPEPVGAADEVAPEDGVAAPGAPLLVGPPGEVSGEADTAGSDPADDLAPAGTGETGRRPALYLRALRYFGFALPKEQATSLPAAQREGLATTKRGEEAPDPFAPDDRYAEGPLGPSGPTWEEIGEARAESAPPLDEAEALADEESLEERESAEWFGQLRTSSGDTPWQLRSKGAYAPSDTGPMAPPTPKSKAEQQREEEREQQEREERERHERERRERSAAARRRAEELMSSAPAEERDAWLGRGTAGSAAEEGGSEPAAPEVPGAETLVGGERARKRLRGRAQSAKVSRELHRDREQEPESGQAGETGQDGVRVRERAAPLPPPEAARGFGMPEQPAPAPAAPQEAGEAPKRRPHAAPWELGFWHPKPVEGPAPQDPQPVDAESAAPAEAAGPAPGEHGRDASGAAAGVRQSPFDGAAESDASEPLAGVARDQAENSVGGDQAMAPGSAPPRIEAESRDDPNFVISAPADVPGPSADEDTGSVERAGAGARQPRIDTAGESRDGAGATAPKPAPDDFDATDPMAGVPAKPALEIDHGTGEHQAFAGGLDEEAADSAEPEPAAAASEPSYSYPHVTPKPALEVDHGTGEQESFAEAMSRRERQADKDTKPRRRLTIDEIEAAERAALRARQRAWEPAQRPQDGQPDAAPSAASSAAPAAPAAEPPKVEHSGRLSRSIRSAPTGPQRAAPPLDPAARAQEVAEEPRPAPEREAAPPTPGVPEPAAAAAKPELQLDHGTGEQSAMTAAASDPAYLLRGSRDTPANGEASASDTPPPAARREAEPAGKPSSGGTRGWRRLARVVTGGRGAPKLDLPPAEVERLRTPIPSPRRIVVLGCTGGAGQSTTALLLGHTLASYRDERVVAVDANPGQGGLSRRIHQETTETLTSLLANLSDIGGYRLMREYTSAAPTGLEVVSTLDDPYVQTLDDEDYAGLGERLERFYEITLLDPAATGVARALPMADALVLVAPASADAARSVAMTFEWLDGHGYSGLRAHSVLVMNGVSKRTLADVDAAEQVARGRCRAIVRTPWDEHVGSGNGVVSMNSLRPVTRRAHGALGGVLVAGLAKQEVRR